MALTLMLKNNVKTAESLSKPVHMSAPAAKNIGQTVHGTSNYYKVFCYNGNVVVAVRAADHTISIRVVSQAGTTLSDSTVAYFKTLGLSLKNGYMSGHLEYGNLTPHHVLAPVVFNPVEQWTAYAASLDACL